MFTICFVQNLIILLEYRKFEEDYWVIIVVKFAIVQFILNLLTLIMWFLSRFPLIFLIESKKFALETKLKDENSLSCLQKTSVFMRVVFDKNEILGFLWYTFFSLLCFLFPDVHYIPSIGMMAVTNLSLTMKNILNSMTKRYKQLIQTAVFLIICLYIFACGAFFFLQDQLIQTQPNGDDEVFCQTLLYCLLTMINFGLRTEGGIGPLFKKPDFEGNQNGYLSTFFFGTLFFIIILVVVLAIVLSIVIDTFDELKEKALEIEKDMFNVCVICGQQKDDLEKNNINFTNHTSTEHNMWVYIDYIIGLKYVDPQETNAINSYVIESIRKKAIGWFPITPQAMQEEENNDTDENNETQKITMKAKTYESNDFNNKNGGNDRKLNDIQEKVEEEEKQED